jgi:RNA polymerase sigma-70 factor (ECF subfamily)
MIAVNIPSSPSNYVTESDNSSMATATRLPKEGASEIRFLRRLQMHDIQAFEILVERCTPRLLAVAKQFLRNSEDAADAVQDTFLLAYLSIHKFRGSSSVYTWLYRILVNACLMKLRSKSSDRSISFEQLQRNDRLGSATGDFPVSARRTSCQVEAAEMKAIIHDCIAALPADYRTVILLRDIEHQSTEETARILRTTCGAVKTRLHRARQALRLLIEDVCTESAIPA